MQVSSWRLPPSVPQQLPDTPPGPEYMPPSIVKHGRLSAHRSSYDGTYACEARVSPGFAKHGDGQPGQFLLW